MHLKRKAIPKFWPVQKTGTKYMAVATHEKSKAIPLIVVLRDILKIVKNKKELKMLLHEKKVAINGKLINEANYPLMLFDCLSFPSIKKYYKVGLENKKFALKEINEAESKHRVYKIIGKKVLPGKKIQLNLSNGRNVLSNEKVNVGDFIVLSNEGKILKTIALKKEAEAIVIGGKYAGREGKIKEIVKEGEAIIARMTSNGEEIKVNIKNLFAKA